MRAHLEAPENFDLARIDRECGKMGLRLEFPARQSPRFAR
jgi:hypothetical protein